MARDCDSRPCGGFDTGRSYGGPLYPELLARGFHPARGKPRSSPRSLLRTAIRRYRANRPRCARQVAETAALGVEVVRLRSPREVRNWMRRTAEAPTVGG